MFRFSPSRALCQLLLRKQFFLGSINGWLLAVVSDTYLVNTAYQKILFFEEIVLIY